jgi:hypothetical protein
VRLEELGQLKKSNDLIGTWTRDLLACSIVPQPTTLPRAPGSSVVRVIKWIIIRTICWSILCKSSPVTIKITVNLILWRLIYYKKILDLVGCILELLNLNLGWNTGYSDRYFRNCLQSRPRPLPSIFSPIHYSLITIVWSTNRAVNSATAVLDYGRCLMYIWYTRRFRTSSWWLVVAVLTNLLLPTYCQLYHLQERI